MTSCPPPSPRPPASALRFSFPRYAGKRPRLSHPGHPQAKSQTNTLNTVYLLSGASPTSGRRRRPRRLTLSRYRSFAPPAGPPSGDLGRLTLWSAGLMPASATGATHNRGPGVARRLTGPSTSVVAWRGPFTAPAGPRGTEPAASWWGAPRSPLSPQPASVELTG